MYSARNDTSASAGLSTADSSSDDPSADIDQLSEDLSLQQAVLASLLDLPQTSTTNEEVAAVRDEIADIKRRLQEAKRKGSIPPGSSTAVLHLITWRLLQSTQLVRAWPTQIGPINLEVRTTICTICRPPSHSILTAIRPSPGTWHINPQFNEVHPRNGAWARRRHPTAKALYRELASRR
jgi:hypothetical protein